jgi:protein O-GlcNAc transferase
MGTMGAQYIDYIIADRIVIPTDQYEFYSEKVACLPNCFQVTDRERCIADKIFTRAEAGLPQDGFVFSALTIATRLPPTFLIFGCGSSNRFMTACCGWSAGARRWNEI